MRWNRHSAFEDKHAVLSASKYHWLNYDEERMIEHVDNIGAAARGTKLHAYAKMAIELGMFQINDTQTVHEYINECIGYRMDPEVLLYHSPWAFGTADAISFRRDPVLDVMVLRIFDLKNGRTKASARQLLVYAALFCLEYLEGSSIGPADIVYDLRIYQNDEVLLVDTDSVEILEVMAKLQEASEMVTKRMEEV